MSFQTFQVINSVVSFFASLLTLILFAMGAVELPKGWGFLSKPGPVVTLLYLLLWFVWLTVGFRFLNTMKCRHQVGDGGTIVPSENWRGTFAILMYVVTIPMTVLWILTWIELVGVPEPGAGPRDERGFFLFIIGGVMLLFGGVLMARLILTIDWFFNPTHYIRDPNITVASHDAQYHGR